MEIVTDGTITGVLGSRECQLADNNFFASTVKKGVTSNQ